MNKTLKKFAIAILATGATVAATTAMAVTDTNTYTNAIQTVSITLTAYTNAGKYNATATTVGGEKPVTINTKAIIAALSNASANIPAFSNFNWGHSPALVIATQFISTNVPLYTTNAVLTNTALLSTTNAATVYFNSNNLAGPNGLVIGSNTVGTFGTNLSGGYAMISNNAASSTNAGTNVITTFGNWSQGGSAITNYISFLGTNGSTDTAVSNATGAFLTNVGLWTLITAATNVSGQTNLTIYTLSNTFAGTVTNFQTNNYSTLQVQGGTASAPVFADISSGGFITRGLSGEAILAATGTNLLKTNQYGHIVYLTKTYDSIESLHIKLFGVTGTGVLDNMSLDLSGFAKLMDKFDVLHTFPHVATNEVGETTSTASIAGGGYIGGTFLATNSGGLNTVILPVPEFTNAFTTNIGEITVGELTNTIPVVVEGTITVGAPHSVAQ
jgi:hypothetical protein